MIIPGFIFPNIYLYSLKSKTFVTYASLFAVIGYTYGGSSGNFNVPDMRGRFPLGVSASHSLSTTGGSETETLKNASQIPSHTHTISGIGNTSNNTFVAGSDTQLVSGGTVTTNATGGTVTTNATGGTVTTNATGGTDSFSIMNPYLSLNYIIKC